MKYTDELAAFDRDERNYAIFIRTLKYSLIVGIFAVFGTAMITDSLMKLQCKAQALRSDIPETSCEWVWGMFGDKTKPEAGYLFQD